MRGQGLVRLRVQHFDFVKRVSQGFRGCVRDLGTVPVEDRALRFDRVTETLETLLCHIENQIALAGMIFGQALQVVLDTGDGVCQGIQMLPVGYGLAGQQLFVDVGTCGLQQSSGTRQGNHRQATPYLGQQLRRTRQVFMVPLRSDELDDGVLGLFQAIARFLDHHLMNLPDIGGRQLALFVACAFHRASHACQGGFDIQQGAGHIHQQRIARLTLAAGQRANHIQLINDDFARLAKAQYRQGIGNLLEGRIQGVEIGQILAITAHEQVEAVFDAHQLLAQCGDHRAHGITVRACQAGTFFVNQVVARQGLVKTVAILQRDNAWRAGGGLGDIEQQVFHQLAGSRLVESRYTLLDQALELLVDLPQQGPDRSTVADAAVGQAFDQAGSNLPEFLQRGILAKAFQAGKDPSHIAQVGR